MKRKEWSYITKVITTVMIITLFSIVCKKPGIFQNIRHGNFDGVTKGKYPGRTLYLSQPHEDKQLAEFFRRQIEANSDVFPLITKHFFFNDETLYYKFKFVAYDDEKDYLIVRYFARIVNQPIYAGYQIQFVFDGPATKLVHIYTFEVPLE